MNRLRYILPLAILWLTIAYTWAVPASPYPMVVCDDNGHEMIVYKHGNEHCHWYEREDGVWLGQHNDGRFYEMSNAEKEHIISSMQGEPLNSLQHAQHLHAAERLSRNIAERGLVILVDFSNKYFLPENTHEAFTDMLMGDNYTYVNYGYNSMKRLQSFAATGSARQYFYDQSMGQYNPQFDVVGPFHLNQPYSYYGANQGGDDCRFVEFVRDACLAAKSEVNFADYDQDNDGEIDFVFIIYAGHGENSSSDPNTIWPASGNYKQFGGTFYLDGKTLGRFAYSCELNQAGTRDGIGVFCHEFGHVLGLMDLYDITYARKFRTLGKWDVMDMGEYNNNGNTPSAYSAYERWFCGWMKPILLNSPLTCELAPITESNQAYLISETGEHNLDELAPLPNTFYLLENRQQCGWDTHLPGHGMLVTKVRYDYSKWKENHVNSFVNRNSYLGIDIIEAKEIEDVSNLGMQSDAFPYGKCDSLTGHGLHEIYTATRYPITRIREREDSIISFCCMGGTPSWENTVFKDVQQQGEYSITDIYQMLSPTVIIPLQTTKTEELRAGTYIIRYSLNGTSKRKYYKRVQIIE